VGLDGALVRAAPDLEVAQVAPLRAPGVGGKLQTNNMAQHYFVDILITNRQNVNIQITDRQNVDIQITDCQNVDIENTNRQNVDIQITNRQSVDIQIVDITY
jgi:uncharacterized protein YjbI with pentapeptide repeats